MSVSKKSKSDDVLIALHESAESVSPSMEAISISGNVSNENGASIDSLKSSELSLEPLDLIARVVSLMKELPILVVACLCVDTNDSGVREDTSILELERGRVISVLNKLVKGVFVEPVSPCTREAIDGNVDVLC